MSTPAGACTRSSSGRATQATAAVLGSVPALLELLPEMGSHAAAVCRALLPGPYTLIVPNPAGRLAHLCGDAPERIGLRVPLLDPGVADLADGAGGLLMTSANLRGGPDPSRLDQVPEQLRAAAALRGGRRPARRRTVLGDRHHRPGAARPS